MASPAKMSSYSSGDEPHLSEVRIVLLGCRAAGKSSAGNTILGREEFDLRASAQCVMRQGDVAGRKITVVEAPGWRSTTAVKQVLKQEVVLSMSMCPPGPHAVLLVMSLDLESGESDYNTLTMWMHLLTKSVWGHSIVLFTFGDRIKDQPIEQYIEGKGKALQRLVKKCGNRYQVFDNNNKNDNTQVSELLKKIEKMVAGNKGHHLEMDRETLRIMEEKKKKRRGGKRSEERMMKAIRKDMVLHRRSEVRIVLLGHKNAGKSSSGNTILGKDQFESNQSEECVKRQGNAAERKITVIEAPGWQADSIVSLCTGLPENEIVQSVSMCPPGPHAVLLVVSLDFTFTEKERDIVVSYLDCFRVNIWSHLMVLFTFGDSLGDTTIERHIESQGPYLQWLVEKCKNRYHVFNNKKRDDDSQVLELLEKIEEMVAENGGCSLEIGTMTLKKHEWKRQHREKPGFMGERRSSSKCKQINTLKKDLFNESMYPDSSIQPYITTPKPECNISDKSSSVEKDTHRFLHLQAGQFTCRFSDLIFEMKMEGEVMYKVAFWNSNILNELGHMEPAGPLYSIECPKGSIQRLHFPHCETQTDVVNLTVARVTSGNIEIIQPHKITDTHVVMDVQQLSLFGILKARLLSSYPTRAQVLLFFKKSISKLYIHLLPGNVPIEEVQKKHENNTYIKTSSRCQLTPGKKYRPVCETTGCTFVCQPEDESFDRDYGPNFHPSFEVLFAAEVNKITLSLLDENEQVVWKPRTVLFTAHFSGTQRTSTSCDLTDADFVDRHRETFIQRVCTVMEIADRLKAKEMITDEMYSMINAKATPQGKMRELYRHLDSEGRAVKAEFCQILREKQRYLVGELFELDLA